MTAAIYAGAIIGVGIALLFSRISAIERRLDRLSRLEAKVDALLEHAGITFDELHGVPAGVRDALERGQTILAIKRVREATGSGMKEAKEYVDEIRRRKIGA
jgi:ribosomal protein L7/L12